MRRVVVWIRSRVEIAAIAALGAWLLAAPALATTPAGLQLRPFADAPQRAAPRIPAPPLDLRARAVAETLRTRAEIVRASAWQARAVAKATRPVALSTPQRDALEDLRRDARGAVEVSMRRESGTPRLIRGDRLERAARARAGRDPATDTARAFLRRRAALLRLDDPDAELALERTQRDALGRTQLRFGQRLGWLRVWPAALIVHLDPGGDVDAMDGASVATPAGLDATPALAANAAVAAARAYVAGALDVVAHELTHGVTHHSANLIYQNESGAQRSLLGHLRRDGGGARRGRRDAGLAGRFAARVRHSGAQHAGPGLALDELRPLSVEVQPVDPHQPGQRRRAPQQQHREPRLLPARARAAERDRAAEGAGDLLPRTDGASHGQRELRRRAHCRRDVGAGAVCLGDHRDRRSGGARRLCRGRGLRRRWHRTACPVPRYGRKRLDAIRARTPRNRSEVPGAPRSPERRRQWRVPQHLRREGRAPCGGGRRLRGGLRRFDRRPLLHPDRRQRDRVL